MAGASIVQAVVGTVIAILVVITLSLAVYLLWMKAQGKPSNSVLRHSQRSRVISKLENEVHIILQVRYWPPKRVVCLGVFSTLRYLSKDDHLPRILYIALSVTLATFKKVILKLLKLL